MLKAAINMLVYAAALLVIGVIAYLAAPTGASAATALIIPGVAAALMIACAVMTIMGATSNAKGKGPGKPGALGVNLAVLLPLLFTLAFAFRALPTTSAYLEAKGALSSGNVLEQAETLADDKGRKALQKDYLVVALWSLTALSAFAFATMLTTRPKLDKVKQTTETTTGD
jgi:hypothetical protein